jgi:hypothetical protein
VVNAWLLVGALICSSDRMGRIYQNAKFDFSSANYLKFGAFPN